MGFITRLQHSWNAFRNRDPTTIIYTDVSGGNSYRPDRIRLTKGKDRSIVTSIYNRIAMDVAAVNIKHCRLDDNNRYLEEIDSKLNRCLTLEANIDQTARAFRQDIVMSLFDEGCVAIVPIDTTLDPKVTDSYDILSMRTGKILEWFPKYVKVRVYNDQTGEKEDIILPKKSVGIIENPLYAVMNEYNSTMQRLIRKLSLLDMTDEKIASGKLDLLIHLPYSTKTELRKQEAAKRMKDIEDQLAGSKYGVAYVDGTEKVTQLNRSLDNNLLKQIESLKEQSYIKPIDWE